MAVFKLSLIDFYNDNSYTTASGGDAPMSILGDVIDPFPVVTYTAYGYDSSGAATGVTAFNWLVSDIIYNKIWLTPQAVDVELITRTTTYDVELWNAYRSVTKSLTDVVRTGQATGVGLDTSAVPITLQPTESIVMTLTVYEDGPSTQETTFTYEITGESDKVLVVTGQRVIFLSIPPLQSGYKITRNYKTNVMRTITGDESRASLAANVKHKLRFNLYAATFEEAYDIKKKLSLSMHMSWGVPMWHLGMTVSSNILSGDTVVNVDGTDWAGLSAGDLLIIWDDWDTFEANNVASVGATQIVLEDSLINGYSAGVRAMPILNCKLSSVQEIKPIKEDFYTVEFEFKEDDRDGGTTWL